VHFLDFIYLKRGPELPQNTLAGGLKMKMPRFGNERVIYHFHSLYLLDACQTHMWNSLIKQIVGMQELFHGSN
jgi:hypothetical protein